jgi:hypothetical protein
MGPSVKITNTAGSPAFTMGARLGNVIRGFVFGVASVHGSGGVFGAGDCLDADNADVVDNMRNEHTIQETAMVTGRRMARS